jgi:hypothetical protein
MSTRADLDTAAPRYELPAKTRARTGERNGSAALRQRKCEPASARSENLCEDGTR